MCKYWKKQHTCTHPSDRPYIEMCRPGFLTNTVCPSICEDPHLRPSHFPCWSCIKALSRIEAESKRREYLHASAASSAQAAVRARLEAEKKGREERVRRDAREKAERERAVEREVRAERAVEKERIRVEGGAWVLAEAGSGKKKKRGGAGSPGVSGSPSTVWEKEGYKENADVGAGRGVWKEEKSDVGGRAGVWGPKRILSRKEGGNAGAIHVDTASGSNGVKK